MSNKVREALDAKEVKEAIGRFRGVRHFFDVGDMSAESDGNTLADAIEEALSALSSPHPEAREEDWIRDAFSQIATGGIKGEPNNYRDTVAVMRDIAKAALSRLAAKEGQGWISVKEMLPEDITPVVVVYRAIRTKGIVTCFAQWWPTIGQGEWRTTDHNSIVEPIYWMPLPSAPATSEKPEEGI